MDDLLGDFLVECFESMQPLDVELARFQQNPKNPEPVAGILRTLHTIKGSCGFLGLYRLEAAAHAAETIVEKHRDGEMAVNDTSVALVLQAFDRLRFILEELAVTQLEPEGDDCEIVERMSHITPKRQKGSCKACKRPIGDAWSRLPRIVRELSVQLGKPIELKITGPDIELDSEIVDLIKGPLMHIARNSADHGLELPEQRQRSGKAETGLITLNAIRDGEHVLFQISDDGQGLDCQRIRERARVTGLMTEAEFADLSDRQVMPFIFKAGFSTACSLTSVSGRGIGMDVVRVNIEKLGGTVELNSEWGKGTVFTIRIPLRPAESPDLVVTCD